MPYTLLRLVADYETYEDEENHRPGDGTPYSGYNAEIQNVRIYGLRLEGPFKPDPNWVFWPESDSVTVDFPVEGGDMLHLVVLRYTDGDTFGHTSGYVALCGAFKTAAEAYERAIAVKKDQWPSGFTSWRGYFARVDSIDVEVVPVLASE